MNELFAELESQICDPETVFNHDLHNFNLCQKAKKICVVRTRWRNNCSSWRGLEVYASSAEPNIWAQLWRTS